MLIMKVLCFTIADIVRMYNVHGKLAFRMYNVKFRGNTGSTASASYVLWGTFL
jgi:hypothetical protein